MLTPASIAGAGHEIQIFAVLLAIHLGDVHDGK
jgi:hypothetical protein